MSSKSTISISFKVSDDPNGLKRITMDAGELRKVMAETVKVSEQLQNKFINFAAFATGLNATSNAVNQLAGVIGNLTAESEGFNKSMKAVNTMAGKDSAGFERLKGQVAELSKEISIARDELANGLYQTISNGVPEDNWIEFLKSSARSAVGGIADINKVVGVTSTLIKNYGLEWSAAADIQDKIQLTAKNGVTSFEQLAQALPRVAGNASTLGVSIDELMGTFATLTGVSGNTAEVSTQLAAIFTALVKPSSEAAKMAAKMGIQFDAAAIKAAGGFQNFLSQLERTVKTYAQASGTLEQEVYGRLFGSAEALRALIPLQGELAEKFTTNVDNMVNSAGTMDAAYADMSSHGEAVNQMLRNQWAAFIDIISEVTSAAQPYINFTAGILSTASSAAILVTTLRELNAVSKLRAFIKSTEIITSNTKGFTKSIATARLFISQFGQAVMQGTNGLRLFATAWKSILVTTGVGAAIVAITSIIAYFTFKTDEATESINKLNDATDVYTQAAATAKTQIEKDIKTLGELIKAKKDTKDAVQKLNETYGEFFGIQKDAEGWYDTLTEKSQSYIKQIGYEAQAKALASKIAEASINKELAIERKAELERDGRHKTTQIRTAGSSVTGYTQTYTAVVETNEYKQAKKAIDEAAAVEAELQKRLDVIAKKVKSNFITIPSQDDDPPEAQENKQRKAQEGSIKYIDERITKIKTEIEYAVDKESRIKLYKELTALETKKWAIEFEYKGGISVNNDKRLREYTSGVLEKAAKEPDAIPELATPDMPESNLEEEARKLKKMNEQLELGKTLTGGMADAFSTLGNAIKGATGEWLNYIGAFFDNASRLLAAIQAMTMGEAAKSAAQTPVIGWLQVGAAMAATAASFASLPKFANGGIISGPTVGLMGEYPGASSNPEVVAPLDKLKSMLTPAGQPVIIGGTLRASGRDIVCVLSNETRIASKSGKRTNIRL